MSVPLVQDSVFKVVFLLALSCFRFGLPQQMTDLGSHLVYMLASQESGSLPAHRVQVPGELAEVPVGSVPGSHLAGPCLVFSVGITFPASFGHAELNSPIVIWH